MASIVGVACHFGLCRSSKRANRLFPGGQNLGAPAAPHGASQEGYNVCVAAGCNQFESDSSNPLQHQCGMHTVCKRCPTPGVSNADICHLFPPTQGRINVIEGSMDTTSSGHHGAYEGGHSEDDEGDEGSFLEINSFDMKFRPSTSNADIKSYARSCAVDRDGFVDVAVRVVLQWYKVPGKESPKEAAYEEEGEEDGMLEMEPASRLSLDDLDYSSDDEGGSFLEIFPQLGEKLRGMFSSDKDSDDDGSDGGDHGAIGMVVHGLAAAGHGAYNRVKRLFKSPKLQVHYSVSHQTLSSCRQSQRWEGSLHGSSLIFTSNQNIRILASNLQSKFFVDNLKVHVTCKDCEQLQSRSCVQVHCAQRQPPARIHALRSFTHPPTAPTLQPIAMHPPPAAGIGHAVPPIAPAAVHTAPLNVYDPNTIVAHIASHSGNFADAPGVLIATIVILLCTIELLG
ncbi:membrane protein, putative [Babesia bigemina]|uniref:Membrane protein, putative n=1 Tax=Babesia bigemina TaxID=5866 RepID=A0A061D1J9_BABBI|nr:membrane protein, putative [Babesia bigemina]CDR94518.1 membrane protein, putative [Babesia bigemina]|eukprot:XP_012766704.1 membrane protein, putative [Babesia bigemina]